MDPIKIVEAVAILILGSWAAIKERREIKARKEYKLRENPERCLDHENRLRTIEKDCSSLLTGQKVLETRLDGVNRRLDNIGEVFNKAGETNI